MARTAEYSIKGYVYQFLRYLSEILSATDGATITIEGAIEDIDVTTPDLMTAVQCKYHEQAEKFTLGKIYKPILLMLEHFSHHSDPPTVHYRLFCYFPGSSGSQSLTRAELDTVLSTSSVPLKVIIARLALGVDLDLFLSRFSIEFGPTCEALQDTVVAALNAKGFSSEDVDAIVYPNAFQRVIDLATKATAAERTVEPLAFIMALHDVRQVTFTRWTRELTTRAKTFQRLRKDLKFSLGQNSRGRYFVIDPTKIANFDGEIVRFIKKFSERYSFKYLHANPPLFAITGNYDVGALQARLHEVGLRCANGLVGGMEFRAAELFRKPMRRKSPDELEFRVRLAKRSVVTETGPKRPDDLFLVNVADDDWDHPDVNVHKFEIERLSDLEYALQLRNDYA